MTSLNRWLLFSLLPGCAAASDPPIIPYDERDDVRIWTEHVAAKHQLSVDWVRGLLADSQYRPQVIANARRPAESRSWAWYRKIFITEDRIHRGRAYLKKHASLLEEAEQNYHVPPEVIAAIIAAESNFGRNTGKHPVLDALLTLGFDYPPRAEFFRKQLEELLLLKREAGLDLKLLKGSWAGALGQAQFIPSSYRNFSVDGDQDGRRDLWNSPADIIFSIANYFHQHHWRSNQPVAEKVHPRDPGQMPLTDGLKPDIQPAQLDEAGIVLQHPLAEAVAVHRFDGPSAQEYWVCHHNFYVITRYNHSALYALMIHQLSQALKHDIES